MPLNTFKDLPRGLRVDAVHESCHVLEAGVVAAVDLAKRSQPALYRGGDAFGDGRRELPQVRQTADRFGAGCAGQMGENRRRLTGVKVAEHKGHGLWVLAFEQPRQMLRVHLLQGLGTAGIKLVDTHKLVQHRLCAGLAQGLDEQAMRGLAATLR